MPESRPELGRLQGQSTGHRVPDHLGALGFDAVNTCQERPKELVNGWTGQSSPGVC